MIDWSIRRSQYLDCRQLVYRGTVVQAACSCRHGFVWLVCSSGKWEVEGWLQKLAGFGLVLIGGSGYLHGPLFILASPLLLHPKAERGTRKTRRSTRP